MSESVIVIWCDGFVDGLLGVLTAGKSATSAPIALEWTTLSKTY